MCLNVFAARGAFDSKSLMEACELLKAKGKMPILFNVDEQTYDYLSASTTIASRPYMASEIMRICKKKEVCPYELVKSALSDAKVIAFKLPLRF